MKLTLRLTDDEHAALLERARAGGLSVQEAARQAVRNYVIEGQQRDRVPSAARREMDAHAEALDKLSR